MDQRGVLFASHRPGYLFAIAGGDIIIRDLMIHLSRRRVVTELHGAGNLLGTWDLGRPELRRVLRRFGCSGRFGEEVLRYRHPGISGECSLFATDRAQLRALEEGVRREQWRSVVTQYAGADDIAEICRRGGTRVFLYVQDWDIEATKRNVRYFVKHRLPILALSRFIQRSIFEEHGVRPRLVHPKLDYSYYRTRAERGRRSVTIAHVHPVKGLATFLELVDAMPSTHFLAVDGWGGWVPMPKDVRSALESAPNVELWGPQDDMRRVFARTRVLIVPSVWQEAFARVVLEAQINGIPVVASRRGGLPEAVGDGGLLIDDHTDVAAWKVALDSLLDRPARHAVLSKRARAHAESFRLEKPDPPLRRLLAEAP